MQIRLLATDLDGTLLDDYKRLTHKNRLALQEAYRQGIQIVLCTGRPYHSVAPYLPQIKIPCWLITNNGSVIRNPEKKIIHTRYLQKESLEQVLGILEQQPRLYYHGSDNQNTYVASRWDRMKNIYGFERKSLNPPVNAALHAFHTVCLSPIHRQVKFTHFTRNGGRLANLIIISRDLEALDVKRKQLEEVSGITLTRSGHDNLEILDRNATKGNALQWLAEFLGLTMEAVAAIGDHDNDLSMIRMAGVGFATGNAEQAVKEQADHITSTNNEDALWDVLQVIGIQL
ncbi:MAG: Cof-type HAD-IIB family hydrolase [Bacillota bacterium]|nr:Cof-type HAD-IIB family hydrolase [Bacillota bacterium]MDW7677869.1 Cof-type HAD-IIB family hydrolase [Bacillota bacterium]